MEWTRGAIIGRGSSATVSLATSATGELFAVKSTELCSSSFLQKEQRFLSQLNSPYIVKYMGFDITSEDKKSQYNLFMEYVAGGTLLDLIKTKGCSLDESMIRFYTHQILEGLDYLHLNGLVHCDIKSQNILIGKDFVKIADLGCARLLEGGEASQSAFSGTPVFMAPEVARGEEQGFPADIWALGCTIVEMATGSNPWPEVNDPVSALYWIGYSGDVPAFPGSFSEDAKDFLDKCLKRDSRERWTTQQLLQHPFLRKLESDSGKENGFTRNSPTSVLDQVNWDSLDESESSQNGAYISFSSNSPAERIRSLIVTSDPSLPNWAGEDDWILVRSYQIEHNLEPHEHDYHLSQYDGDLIHAESFIFPVINQEQLDNSIVDEHSLLEFFLYENSNFESSIVVTELFLCYEGPIDPSVSKEQNIDKNFMKLLVVQFKKNCWFSIFNFFFLADRHS